MSADVTGGGRPLRTWLFVPGHRPERFDKALGSGADRIIVDLEDAVAPADKPAARAAFEAWRPAEPGRVALRLNAPDSPWFEDDLAAAARSAVATVVCPKAEDPGVLARVARACPGAALVPLIESGAGLAAARSLAAAPSVRRLALGHIDLQVDLGMRDAREDELLPVRLELVLASRLAGIEAPIDGVSVALDDAASLAEDVARARRLGFGGKLCIHPRQVAGVRAGFLPGEADVAWAQRVLQAMAAAGGAAVAVDGRMVDKPVLLRAQAILREAGVPAEST